MPIRYVSLVVAAVLLTATGCREIVPPAVDMGGGSDMAVDMGEPDMGPCHPVCRSSEVCDPNADGGPACVGCLSTDDCNGSLKCDLDSHTCVSCLEDADCTLPATSVCNLGDHTCVACTTGAQCSRFAATPACAPTEGCVECTHAAQGACAGNVCDSTEHTCTDRAPHTVDICGECVSDDDCLDGEVCVAMEFGDPGVSVGKFCLFRKAATGLGAPNNDCTSVRVFRREVATTTVDGEAGVAVCSPGTFTTCPALNDYPSHTCDAETPAGNAQCGAALLDDGYCTSSHLCTVACTVTEDCKNGATCAGTGFCTW